MNRRDLLLLLAASALPARAQVGLPSRSEIALPGRAEAYPRRPIRIIVPFTPGTGMDILARTLGQKVAERWSNPIVVENRPGASGNIGTDAVAKSAPDGYTLLVTANTIVLNRGLFKSIPYDPIRDFEPVLPLALGKMALVVHPSVKAANVAELVALAKASPGRIDYASPGRGTPHHLAMELFKQSKGIDMTHVPYKGTGPALTDLLGGQVKVMFLPLHVAQPQVEAGKLRVLEGLSGIDVDIWYGLYAPAWTPRDVISRLNVEFNTVLQLPDMIEALANQGLAPTGGSAAELARLTRTDLDRWEKVVRDARIEAE